ncbi:DUF1275 domain-containing protein (plasmid) [Nicoliella spurrieriana]|uniref:DUF1275 domain-containing protein n=1 Tax=Nicoliella spurrieriana TaxID=2925830 RepID=A0A976X4V0_9LACO|nr:YoaK family protein [Nicoliella spurrieriana]UQS86114.1 DUF1275 domain-containing protein [Nicoliella spurrieriana]
MKIQNHFEMPLVAALLAVISGSTDAYTYIEHGGVFAGLQTGNIILMSINLSRFNFIYVLRSCFSILIFAIGVIIIKIIQRRSLSATNRKKLVIKYELILLIIAGITAPWVPDLVTIGILDLSAAAHLQEFKLMRGRAFNPLMMTGNLSKVSNNLYLTIFDHDQDAKRILVDTIIIISSFICGAIIMGITTSFTDEFAILITAIPLILILFIVQWTQDNDRQNNN